MFEVWWKITEEMTMKLITLLLVLFTVSCSQFDDTTFSVVCELKTNTIELHNGDSHKNSFNESKTYIFKNKKLEGYNCSRWNNEEITCSTPPRLNGYYDVLNFDRLSGKFSSHKVLQHEDTKNSRPYGHEDSTGKCEKVKENKF